MVSYDTARQAYTCILQENDIMPLGNSHCIILRQFCDGFRFDSENNKTFLAFQYTMS